MPPSEYGGRASVLSKIHNGGFQPRPPKDRFFFRNIDMLYTVGKIFSCSFRIKIATWVENAYFRSYKRFRKVYRNQILAFYKGDMLKSIKTNILNLKINDVSFNILA